MNDLNLLRPAVFPAESIIAGFTTRLGGVSRPPFDSLNLGTRTADDPESVRENYRILTAHLGVTRERMALMGQVHGNSVRVIDRGGIFPDTDCLLTTEPGILVCVRVADCVPVLVHDPQTGIIGAIHCGWRPIAEGIIEKAVAAMWSGWNADQSNLIAALGPSTGPCCYEVGPEVAERFSPSSIERRGERLYADLHGEIRGRLRAVGMLEQHIESLPGCTICGNEVYFSHRRDGARAGRMMGYIMMVKDSDRVTEYRHRKSFLSQRRRDTERKKTAIELTRSIHKFPPSCVALTP
jgi:polyphenol oxidase